MWLALTGLFLLVAPAAVRAQQPALADLVQAGVNDLSATVVLVRRDQRELEQMGKDFANVYRFGKARMQFLEPGRMRMESSIGFLKVLYVVNPERKLFAVPGIGVRSVKDVRTSPSARQGLLEMGLVTPSLLEMVQVAPLGPAVVEGKDVWRYALTYEGDASGRRQEIAVDPRTRTIMERLLYRPDGALQVRFVFGEPAAVAEGVWVPTRVDVYSPRGRHAAATRNEAMRVNTGLEAEAFSF